MLSAPGGNITVGGNVTLTGDSFTGIDIKANISSGQIQINGNVLANASTGDARIDLEARNIGVNGNVTGIGVTDSEINVRGTNVNNINITGNVRATAPGGRAEVRVEGDGQVQVGSVTGQGSSVFARLDGGNLNFGAVNLSANSFATLVAFGGNNMTANGPINVNEAGGGFAQAIFGANGLATLNGAVNVNAGPGGFARASFGGSEGPALNNVLINRQVVVNGAAGDIIEFNLTGNARTAGAGLLRADEIRIDTGGAGQIIDLDTRTPLVEIYNFGSPPSVTINNSTFGGPTSVFFGGSSPQLRSATFLANNDLTFLSGFSADNLLAGAPNGIVNFQGPVFISGASPFAPTPPDLALFNILSSRELVSPGHGPNVQILGGRGINMQNPFVLGGPDPFIKMFSNVGFNTPGLTTTSAANSVTAVFNPINLAAPILFTSAEAWAPLRAE